MTGLATLVSPCGLALDKDGNFLITDIDRMMVFKMTPQGALSVIAGLPGMVGSANGPSSRATFNFPTNVVVDKEGNLIVADAENSAVRKISPTGMVTNILDDQRRINLITANGSVTLLPAPLDFPSGLAVDAAGNIFVADPVNNVVSKISSKGEVSTVAGKPGVDGAVDGKAAEVRFGLPRAVAVDPAGVLYVADEEYNTIRKVAADGSVTTLAGNPNLPEGAPGRDGTGIGATFVSPRGLTLDAKGNIYVADTNGHTIRKITPGGIVSTLAGTAGVTGGADGHGSAAQFGGPAGLAVDGSGNVFVADSGNNTIR